MVAVCSFTQIILQVDLGAGIEVNHADSKWPFRVSKAEVSETSEGNDHSEHLEKGEDGKYYDKETGKAYDSIEAWEKAQETLAKRYEGTAQYYEDKAKKEWAQ